MAKFPFKLALFMGSGCDIGTGPFSSMYQDPRQSVDFYLGASGPTSFGRTYSFEGEMFANSGSGNMVGIAAASSLEFTEPSQCSKGLCLRYFSIEQRDLQRQDYCNLRRNTGHLRVDVGNRSEPELHASDPCTAAAASNWASGRHHQSRNLDRKLFSQTERLGESARIDHQRVFSIWNNEQLRTHYCPAKSHWEHFPKCQCAY